MLEPNIKNAVELDSKSMGHPVNGWKNLQQLVEEIFFSNKFLYLLINKESNLFLGRSEEFSKPNMYYFCRIGFALKN